MINKMIEKVNKLKPSLYIMIMILGTNLVMVLLNMLLQVFHLDEGNGGPDFTNVGLFSSILIVALAGPVLESVGIALGVKLLKKIGIRNRRVQFLIILLFFSLLHTYSIIYMILITIPATVIIFSYLCYRNHALSPFWVMTMVHAGYNIVSLLLIYFS